MYRRILENTKKDAGLLQELLKTVSKLILVPNEAFSSKRLSISNKLFGRSKLPALILKNKLLL